MNTNVWFTIGLLLPFQFIAYAKGHYIESEYPLQKTCAEMSTRAKSWSDEPFEHASKFPYTWACNKLACGDLWIGTVCAACDKKWLEKNAIEAVVNVAQEWNPESETETGAPCPIDVPFYPLGFAEHAVIVPPPGELEIKLLEAAIKTRELLKNYHVLLHCNMGIARSVSVAVIVEALAKVDYAKKLCPHISQPRSCTFAADETFHIDLDIISASIQKIRPHAKPSRHLKGALISLIEIIKSASNVACLISTKDGKGSVGALTELSKTVDLTSKIKQWPVEISEKVADIVVRLVVEEDF